MSYKICNRCVMDTTIKKIDFDANGVCNYCKAYTHRVATELYKEPVRSQKLNNLIEKMKNDGRGKQYDCVIGISGGVDSSFVAHLVHTFGLRPLAIHLDNGWNSELAEKNIKNLVDKLGIELQYFKVDESEFLDLQRSFILSSIENIEIPTDHAINALLLKVADKNGIKYILNGSNLVTEGILPIQGGMNIDYRLLKDIHSKFGGKKLITYPSINIFNYIHKIIVKRIKYIPILNYIDFDKEDAMGLLENNYGWKKYGNKHYESIFTRFFQGYILPNKFNYDKRKPHLSTMIMSGQITRNDALEELNKNTYTDAKLLEQDMKFFLDKFSFSLEDFEKIMKTPPRTVADFKSYESILERLKPLVLRFKNYAKGSGL